MENKFTKTILLDLARQYYYEGRGEVAPGKLALCRRIFHPRFSPVFIYRISFALNQKGLSFLAKMFSLMNFMVFGIEISLTCKIGPGLYLPHTVGTVIGATRIGKNALIYQGVSIGAKDMDLLNSPDKRPNIGDNVMIGSGAKILGGVFVGDNAVIAANAVVIKDVPEGALMAGVPAKKIK